MLVASLLLVGTLETTETAGAVRAPGVVVASELANPRGIAVTDDGLLYIAESGTGGTEELPPLPDGDQQVGAPIKRGTSGVVTQIVPGGAKRALVTGLPSIGGLGPAGLVAANGSLWLVTGGAGPVVIVDSYQPLPNEASLLRINPQTGDVTKVADLGAYEETNNPDGFAVDPNPWGVALGIDGNVYVTDAAGNSLLRVNPVSGELSLVTVLAGLPDSESNTARGNRNERDPVPTGVVVDTDGTIYVGLLGGGPPTAGRAKVVRVARDGTISDAVPNLNYVVFLTIGPDKLLYVSELTTGFDTTAREPALLPGRVLRIGADGTPQVVADNLNAPTGIAFDKTGNLYVAVNTVVFGPIDGPPRGQVLRFDGVATTTIPALPATGAGGRATPILPRTLSLATLGLIAALGVKLLSVRRRTN
jgi:sugar lactone lactonase YvrE